MKLSVLVVDDEPLVGRAIARMLTAHGHQATSSSSPAQALEALGSLVPRWVVSDLNMPEMRGTVFLLEVKRRFPQIRRALVSGTLSQVTLQELQDLEPCALVNKPFRYTELMAALQALDGALDP
jgi:two-component system response regulator YesN